MQWARADAKTAFTGGTLSGIGPHSTALVMQRFDNACRVQQAPVRAGLADHPVCCTNQVVGAGLPPRLSFVTEIGRNPDG